MTWTVASNGLQGCVEGELDVLGRTISHYRVLEKIGQGAMGEVYRAEDLELGRVVALKFPAAALLGDEDAHRRLKQEARAAASLDHPCLPTVYEVCQTDNFIFLALALIEGETLAARLARGALPVEHALSTAQQIAEGLQHVHSRGIVHRDVKPSNIMLRPDGRATLLDFGVSAPTVPAGTPQPEEIVGTAAYMSPEQTTLAHVDHRTDVWSLGCVLYEMLAGRPLFDMRFEAAVLYAIVNEAPEPLTAVRSDVPPELEAILKKCLSKNRDERYQSAAELAADLQQLRTRLESATSTPSGESSIAHRSSTRRRNSGTLISRFPALGALGVAAGSVSKWFWPYRSSAPAVG